MKITKAFVDSDLRARIFTDIFDLSAVDGVEANAVWSGSIAYRKVNDRQWGCILTDVNGAERYCRIGVIVAEEREDMSASELMEKEINDYKEKQEAKAQKEKEKQEKIARDKEKREKEKEKEGE